YKDKSGEFQEQTEWHNIVCWRSLAERTEKFVKKGSQLFIEGRIRSRSWEDKSGQPRYTVEIVADTLQILGKRQEEANTQQIQPNIQEIIPPDDGDLPF
ncbi:MAG: single-stranded DNA-binding protein, partial [Bacteroidales bacterium]|nr:single-stranded DNA-binding protein [Bacteroidales bacterium]